MSDGLIIRRYQEWLYDFIQLNDYVNKYGQLLLYLSGQKFTWSVHHDDNRAKDGNALRKEFSSFYKLPDDFWIGKIPEECSLLEMMIALSMRCDDVIFTPENGDRYNLWFWEMIKNIGLDEMDKFNFDKAYCDEVVDRLLKRRYLRDGRGGFFRTRNPKIDMRKAEIWYQMNVWLEENF